MLSDQRRKRIEQAIESKLQPTDYQIIDESHMHIGHAGAKSGLSHIAVEITANAFNGLNSLQKQRQVYQALGTLMQTDIHALRFITLKAPSSDS